jgi:predicted dehydrogenase
MSAEASIRIAQIGCGYWGKNLLRNFARLGALAAVVDHDKALTAKAHADYGASIMTFDEVLADPAIDAVALATPAVTHSPLAMLALEAGKHVFVEKPIALEPADAEKLHALATIRGLTLMVGHLLQYHPIFIALRDMVAAGVLGDLLYVYSNRMSLGKFRTEENVLWSFAPHDISMILALVGGEEPETVKAQAASFVTPGIADWSTLQMRFASGVHAHVQASWLHPFKEQRLTVIGTKAMAVFEDSKPDWQQRLALYRHGIDRAGTVPVPLAAPVEYIDVEKREPLLDECHHFLECIRSGTAARTDGAEGLRVLRVLDLAEKSLTTQGG